MVKVQLYEHCYEQLLMADAKLWRWFYSLKGAWIQKRPITNQQVFA